MVSVWAIEDGQYSDYHVIGVYSSKANALVVAKAIGLNEDNVNEWPVNLLLKEINRGLNVFQVVMLKDGTTESIRPMERANGFNCPHHFFWDRPKADYYKQLKEQKGIDTPAAVQANVWARNEKHAIKIVNEIRTQMIANGEWK